ncbi:MAG: hypothetical protein HY457_02865 [Parcubacteria group bacterium]|nr:hypothetical protein [Parcubacteria group bacterium]
MEILLDIIYTYGDKLYFVGLILAFLGLLYFVFILFFDKTPFGSDLTTENFFKLLDKKFDLNLVKDKTDVINLAESFSRKEWARYSLAPLLEDYLRHLIELNVDELEKEKTQLRYDTVKKMLNAENEERPFGDIPDEERRLLQSLRISIGNNDQQVTESSLEDLRILIATRNKIYAKSQKINWWSVPLAIAGLVVSMVFGVMGIIQGTIDYEEIKKIINSSGE